MYRYIHILLSDEPGKQLMQLYVRGTQVVQKNGLLVRLKMALFGYAKLCNLGHLEFYAFRCPVHGLTTDYARGYGRYLDCSYCRSD